MSHEQVLRCRIKWLTWSFMIGLFISGVTAIPLAPEVNLLASFFGPNPNSSAVSEWLWRVHDALTQTQAQHSFLFYGTDWLAFGHFAIALAFWGAVRDPSEIAGFTISA